MGMVMEVLSVLAWVAAIITHANSRWDGNGFRRRRSAYARGERPLQLLSGLPYVEIGLQASSLLSAVCQFVIFVCQTS
uniref:Uncharacterized protein n=1 Tax=Oryza glumipatula TaxID=40148 RepID=A0A0E0BVB8_9ORYZ